MSWAVFLSIYSLLRPSVLDLRSGTDGRTDRQTDRQSLHNAAPFWKQAMMMLAVTIRMKSDTIEMLESDRTLSQEEYLIYRRS